MHPVYNLSACVLVVATLGAHLWLAQRVEKVAGKRWGLAALLVPFVGLALGARHFRQARVPTVAVLACVVALLALGRAAGQDLEARAAARARARDAGVNDEDRLGFGD